MTTVPMGAPPLRVTIVMYHYVRRLAGSRFPRLTALELDAFRGQLDFIRRYYTPVSIVDLVLATHGHVQLPPRAIVLTFDDGYTEHYRDTWPLLEELKMPAAFFPAASSLIDRRVLDVNKIQFVLAAADTPDQLVLTIDEAVARAKARSDVKPLSEYRADGWKAVRFDSPAASYVKYMLQGALPEDLRTAVLDELFSKLVSSDERAFADELYMRIDQAREMSEAGMTIGGHADRHVTLTSLSRDGQVREIDGALRVLDAVGASRSRFVFSYAKGAHNADSISLLRDRGCVLAVTNRCSIATVAPDTLLSLPRLDANHLPTDASAPPNQWTMRA
jgi:peptidoglycan/xylan/chitin deacetylase (PgdA/CDA1 family)